MSGPKRNPDKLNTIGVVVVGICGAVLVYVTIVALEAFYVNDTSEIQTMADYGGQDTTAKAHKAAEMQNITQSGKNPAAQGAPETFHVPIDVAMKKVVESANGSNADPSHLVPALGPATKPTIQPVFGRPKLIAPPAPPAPEAGSAAGSAAAPAPAAGSAAAPAPAAGSAAPAPKATGAGSAAEAHGH